MKRYFLSAAVMIAALSFSLNADAQNPKKVKANSTLSASKGKINTIDKSKDASIKGTNSMGSKNATTKYDGRGGKKNVDCFKREVSSADRANQQKTIK